MQPTATDYENAKFLRELAQTQLDDWVRTKVAAARSDTSPAIPQSEVASRLSTRYARRRDASH